MSESSEKPTKVEVGQRYEHRHAKQWGAFTVVRQLENGLWLGTWSGLGGDEHVWATVSLKADCTLLPCAAAVPPVKKPTLALTKRQCALADPLCGKNATSVRDLDNHQFCDIHRSFGRWIDAPPTPEKIMPATAEQTARDDSGNRPVKPAQFPKREVSHDGRTWIDYTRLTDADPFDSYTHRRLDGVVAAIVETRGVRIVGTYDGDEQTDWVARAETDALEATKPAASPASQPWESHNLGAGLGIWSLR